MKPFFIFVFGFVSVLRSAVSFSAIKRSSRIFGGEPTEPHQYPFAAVSLIATENDDDFLCGGVLISNKHILMAAQCVYQAEFLRTSVGLHEYSADRTDINYLSDELAQYLTIHELFDPQTLSNNIAILRAKEELQFSEKIQSIALPTASLSPESLRGWTGTIIGWGNFEGSAEIVSGPRHANVTILPLVICAHYYPAQDTNSTVFCSDGDFNTGACRWDEGGPLITTLDDGSEVLIGLVSLFGDLECGQGWPTAYVNVASYLDWIQVQIGVDQI